MWSNTKPRPRALSSMALLKASHTTRDHSSDFIMMHNESGIETIIAMSESTCRLLSYGNEEDATFLSPTIDLSNTGVINFNITPFVSTFTIGSTQPRQRSVGEHPKPDDNAEPIAMQVSLSDTEQPQPTTRHGAQSVWVHHAQPRPTVG